MSSYRQIVYHIVFGTKNHVPVIDRISTDSLLKYMTGVIKKRNCLLYRINGVKDHVHILTDLHPSISLSDFVKETKVASSRWMKESGLFPDFKSWQEGYGAFTCSIREKDTLISYIDRQEEHHRRESFLDEYKRLLIENGVDFDSRYLL